MGPIKRMLDYGRRKIDLTELWPACQRVAADEEGAKVAFLWHVMQDPAWTDHYTEAELCKIIRDL